MGDQKADPKGVSTDPADRPPFYKRPITPRWLPAWLVICLVVGLTVVVILEYVFGAGTWQRRCLAFVLGFFVALAGFSYDMPAESGPDWAPPKWLRAPVIAIAFLLWLYGWVEKLF